MYEFRCTPKQWRTAGQVEYGPDGAWAEGPGYWRYATQYNVVFLAALETALNGFVLRERCFEPADDNEADAIAILLWAIETNGGLA